MISIRITDKGVLIAVAQTMNTLILLSVIEETDHPKSIKELYAVLVRELEKYISWIEKRKSDGTCDLPEKDILKIIKDVKYTIKRYGRIH